MASPAPTHASGNAPANSITDTKGTDWNNVAKMYRKMTHDTIASANGFMLERANALRPFSEATSILDDGCGPGSLTARLIEDYSAHIPAACRLICADFSEGMVTQVLEMRAEALAGDPTSLWDRVEAKVQDGMNLSEISSASQSHVLASLVFFMTPNPQKCLSEVHRVLQPGGVHVCSSWETNQWLDVMRAIEKVCPGRKVPEMPNEWTSTSGVKAELETAGLRNVETHRVAANMHFEHHEELCRFFLTRLPHMIALTKDLGTPQREEALKAMVVEMKRLQPQAPGELKGWVIVGVGRK